MQKNYQFLISLSETMLQGDEFWEKVIDEDSTGISPLYREICRIIDESNLVPNHKAQDFVEISSFTVDKI